MKYGHQHGSFFHLPRSTTQFTGPPFSVQFRVYACPQFCDLRFAHPSLLTKPCVLWMDRMDFGREGARVKGLMALMALMAG